MLVKHGATYVRVHPSRLILYPDTHHDTCEPVKHHSQNNVTTNGYVPINDGNETDDNPEQYACDKSPKIVTKSVQLPKPGQTIKCKFTNDEDHEWRKLNVISRAGKATGKNKYLMNVAMEEGDPFWLDFENGVLEWETNEDDQTATNEGPEVSLLMDSSNDQLDEAKKRELQSWVEHQVYTQVPYRGQPKILTRWVYTNKESNGKQTFKARLVAKGFQDKNACNVRNDSPICPKESLRAVLGVMSANGWVCKSMDIKTAFLQSKRLDQPIYLLPPKEANVPTGYIWK